MKAIAIIRTSTSAQEIETQKTEILEYAKSFGYKDIILIGAQGTSAIKLDDEYLMNMQLVKDSIENDPKINCVFAWAIDRIGRNEEILMNFKNFCISHKIQLRIKEPTLYLLNDDGTVNAGMELAFALFATMSKQEMEQKKARFKRAKTRMKAEGRFAGGSIKNGYTTDKNGYIHLDPDSEGYSTIKEIFTEYATGNWSITTLSKEINSRGLKTNRGRLWTAGNLHQTLINKGYIEIVGQELYDKCQEVMANRWHSAPRNRTTNNLAVGILKCRECGGNYTRFDTKYRCLQHSQRNPNKPECHCKDCIDVNKMDDFLWRWAKNEEQTLRSLNSIELLKRDKATIKVLSLKISKIETEISKVEDKKLKIQEGYENGIYTKEQYTNKIDQLKATIDKMKKEIMVHKNEIRLAKKRVSEYDKNEPFKDIKNIGKELDSINELDKYELVHKHIKQALIRRISHDECEVSLLFASNVSFVGRIK